MVSIVKDIVREIAPALILTFVGVAYLQHKHFPWGYKASLARKVTS